MGHLGHGHLLIRGHRRVLDHHALHLIAHSAVLRVAKEIGVGRGRMRVRMRKRKGWLLNVDHTLVVLWRHRVRHHGRVTWLLALRTSGVV